MEPIEKQAPLRLGERLDPELYGKTLLICSICCEAPIPPFGAVTLCPLPDSEHILCMSCCGRLIDDLLEKDEALRCPTCRQLVEDTSPKRLSASVTAKWGSAIVSCATCKSTMPLEDLARHRRSECPHRADTEPSHACPRMCGTPIRLGEHHDCQVVERSRAIQNRIGSAPFLAMTPRQQSHDWWVLAMSLDGRIGGSRPAVFLYDLEVEEVACYQMALYSHPDQKTCLAWLGLAYVAAKQGQPHTQRVVVWQDSPPMSATECFDSSLRLNEADVLYSGAYMVFAMMGGGPNDFISYWWHEDGMDELDAWKEAICVAEQERRADHRPCMIDLPFQSEYLALMYETLGTKTDSWIRREKGTGKILAQYSRAGIIAQGLQHNPRRWSLWSMFARVEEADRMMHGVKYDKRGCFEMAVSLNPNDALPWMYLSELNGATVHGQTLDARMCVIRAIKNSEMGRWSEPWCRIAELGGGALAIKHSQNDRWSEPWYRLADLGGGDIDGEHYSIERCIEEARKKGGHL